MNPGFRTPDGTESYLEARELGADLWMLLAPLHYHSVVMASSVVVPIGFLTDLESIPRWLPAARALLHGYAKRAAAVHDMYYQSHSVARATADAVFYEAMGALGVPGIKRWPMWAAVRAFGWAPWRRAPERRMEMRTAALAYERKTSDFA